MFKVDKPLKGKKCSIGSALNKGSDIKKSDQRLREAFARNARARNGNRGFWRMRRF